MVLWSDAIRSAHKILLATFECVKIKIKNKKKSIQSANYPRLPSKLGILLLRPHIPLRWNPIYLLTRLLQDLSSWTASCNRASQLIKLSPFWLQGGFDLIAVVIIIFISRKWQSPMLEGCWRSVIAAMSLSRHFRTQLSEKGLPRLSPQLNSGFTWVILISRIGMNIYEERFPEAISSPLGVFFTIKNLQSSLTNALDASRINLAMAAHQGSGELA